MKISIVMILIIYGCALFLIGVSDSLKINIWLGLTIVTISLFAMREYIYVIGWSLVLIMCLFAQWGVSQFIVQHDLGLRLAGETILGSDIAGIAKFGSSKMIRSYGPFEHANILGGLSLLALMSAQILFKRCSNRIINIVIIFTLSLGVILSFSRTAILGSIILGIMAWRQGGSKRIGQVIILVMILFIIVLSPLLWQRIYDDDDKAVEERWRGYQRSVDMIITNNFWYGIGFKNYKNELKKLLDETEVSYQIWEIDYVHSVPLLVVAQIGLISGTGLIAAVAIWIYRNLSMNSLVISSALWPALMFDHFFITQAVAFVYLMVMILILKCDKSNRLKCV